MHLLMPSLIILMWRDDRLLHCMKMFEPDLLLKNREVAHVVVVGRGHIHDDVHALAVGRSRAERVHLVVVVDGFVHLYEADDDRVDFFLSPMHTGTVMKSFRATMLLLFTNMVINRF